MVRFYAVPDTPILLGRNGENLVREIAFDISDWLGDYGEGHAQLAARRHGESEYYLVPVRRRGKLVLWQVTDADVGIPGLTGECELSWIPDSGAFAKSETWRTQVLRALDGGETEAPEVSRAWLDAAREESANTQRAAEAAEDAAEQARRQAEQAGAATEGAREQAREAIAAAVRAGDAAAAAEGAAAQAESARQAVENLGVEGYTLSPDSQVSVEKTVTDSGVALKFFIPKGEKGDQGDPLTVISYARIQGDGSPGTTDTYAMVLSDGTELKFQVYNGRDGNGLGDMEASVYDPQGRAQDIFQYIDEALKKKADLGADGRVPDEQAPYRMRVSATRPGGNALLWFKTRKTTVINPNVLAVTLALADEGGSGIKALIDGRMYDVENVELNAQPTGERYSIELI